MSHLAKACVLCLLLSTTALAATCHGLLADDSGHPLSQWTVALRRETSTAHTTTTGPDGKFQWTDVIEGSYTLSVASPGRSASAQVNLPAGDQFTVSLQLSATGQLQVQTAAESGTAPLLSSKQVSALPLNKRDFSQLLLLAAGAQTDTNGAANFTAQFAINGQRATAQRSSPWTASTPAIPNSAEPLSPTSNVDAIAEVRSDSGAVPADIGHGAASFINVITKSGTDHIHGAAFEFVRNAAFDARNYFDPGPVPPFQRNEFGMAIGGPIIRNRTFFFAQYQGFRQILSSTQVLSVPTADERRRFRYHRLPRRHALRARESPDGVLARPLPASQRSRRSLRSPHLCDIHESRHQHRSVLPAAGSQTVHQGSALPPLQPR